ncbi:sodium/calcium exchanger family protein/calcium-binding EF hand family protein [Forsythia ovata]|uniref:Sodium/calcium exchanger family protein/calcium-binding EF hand family protein n=1 Tax=Forsythia ovata TaxID=205694 RepID=A0ABD1S573_9LAMI
MAVLALRFLVLILFISFVQCRILRLNSSDDLLISDGIDLVDNQSPILTANVSIASKNTCDHQYGFLPCAENAGGYIFQILIYQGLLMFGEKEMSTGSRVLFNILGTSNIVGIIFRILVGLPAILMMIVSGVFSSKEDAQSKVSLGVGIYAGMTVFTLTLQWGICVIFGRRKLEQELTTNHTEVAPTISDCLLAKEVVSDLKDSGVTIDKETRYTAGIMLLSLIPYIIVQLVDIFNTSFGSHIVILIALILSSLSLLSYFAYQVMNPWMQEKSLAYSKYETVRKGFLLHMQQHGKLIDEHGNLNVPILNPKKEDEPKEIDWIRSKIQTQAQRQLLKAESLITDDGNPNIEGIKNLFKKLDTNNNNEISKTELEKLIRTVNFGDLQSNYEDVVNEMFKDLDKDGNDAIDEPEFVNGIKEMWNKSLPAAKRSDEKGNVDEFHKIVKEKVLHGNSLVWTFIKSVLQVVLGIVIMTYLGGPLTTSILQLSNSMNVSSFAISFVVVPLAMNARAAIAAISPASHKSEKTASLTFSEIYGGVVMSNISNLTALLAIVYAKDLTWDYSAEVLTVLVVCAIIGFMAYSRDSYPLWTFLLAFFLYPFSLGLFYYAQFVLRWN